MSDKMNERIEELLKMLGDVDDFNREIIEKGSVKVEKEGEIKKDDEVKKEEKKAEVKRIMSPKEIVKETSKYIIGHDEAKMELATILFKFLMERENEDMIKKMGKELTRSNVLITGKSSGGKTALITTMCDILGLDYSIIDSTNCSAQGYKGSSFEEELEKHFKKCEYDEHRINRSVVILDEIDKLRSNGGDQADVNGQMAIQGLLRIMDSKGQDIECEVSSGYFKTKKTINSGKILFVGTGTFQNADRTILDIVGDRLNVKGKKRAVGFFGEKEEIKEEIKSENELRKNITVADIAEYGMMLEIVNRFNFIINLPLLTKEQYVEISKLNKNGFGEYEAILKMYGKKLIVKNEVYEILGEQISKSEAGSRGLKQLVDKIMIPIVYEITEEKRKKNYTITGEMVNKVLGLGE